MKKTLSHYFSSSWKTLFQKHFLKIVGSSLLLTSSITLVFLGSFYVFALYSEVWSTFSAGSLRWLFGIYCMIVCVICITLRGWSAIVMSVRSIDHTKHMNIREDWQLFRTHFPRYIAYTTWYSLVLLVLILTYTILVILSTALHEILGGIIGIIGGLYIIYRLIGFSLSWYHMFSEQSSSWKIFKESRKLIGRKIGRVFLTILGFSLIVYTMSGITDIGLFRILALIGIEEDFRIILIAIQNNSDMVWNILTQTFSENKEIHTLSILLVTIFYTLSRVISEALFHIFYVRYYLDIREEHENEYSFLRDILTPSSQR